MGFPSRNPTIGNPNLIGAKKLDFAAFLSLAALKVEFYQIEELFLLSALTLKTHKGNSIDSPN
ncbi:hypothetical protein GIB67_021928, partial [Kingdonia uniflora]